MLVFRSLTIGLLSACFLLLITRPIVEVRMTRGPRLHVSLPAHPPTIIDVAPGVSGAQLASLIRLAPGEHVASIDDAAVNGDLGAGVVLAGLDLHGRQFIDLGVSGASGERRVLVLLH